MRGGCLEGGSLSPPRPLSCQERGVWHVCPVINIKIICHIRINSYLCTLKERHWYTGMRLYINKIGQVLYGQLPLNPPG